MPGVGNTLQCHRYGSSDSRKPHQTRIDTSSPTDVWQNLLIATQPDQMIGRKRDILSIRQSPSSPYPLCVFFSFKRVASSVENPERQTQTASDDYSTNQIRAQNVDGTSASFFSLILALQKNKPVISTQPPSPFYPLPGGVPPPSNHLLLTASFGRILPVSLLSLFRPTHTLNVHPSALPAYRGPAPIQRAILNGERDTAVCVIEMKRRGGIDAGDILGRVPIVRAFQPFSLI
jgi:methionyl-tRNA formyltransferase